MLDYIIPRLQDASIALARGKDPIAALRLSLCGKEFTET
jgi:hypothetical protein